MCIPRGNDQFFFYAFVHKLSIKVKVKRDKKNRTTGQKTLLDNPPQVRRREFVAAVGFGFEGEDRESHIEPLLQLFFFFFLTFALANKFFYRTSDKGKKKKKLENI